MSLAAAAIAYLLVGVGLLIALNNRGDGSREDRVVSVFFSILWPGFLLIRIGVWMGER